MRAHLMACAVGAAFVVTAVGQQAVASSPSVEIEYMSSMGEYNGYDYVFVEGVMRGTVEREDGSTGEYEVPIIMAYPRSGGNGVGVVDLSNTAYFALHFDSDGQAVMCGRGTPYCEEGEYAGRRLEEQNIPYGLVNAEDLLYRRGYTYIATQVDKGGLLAPEPPDGTSRRRLTYGTIENPLDAFEIALDSTRFVRDPSEFTGNGAPAPKAQDHVIAHGFSATGQFWRRWLIEGHNDNPAGGIHIDGFLMVTSGATCAGIREEGPPYLFPDPCPGAPPTGDALAIAIDSESDVELLGGAFSRNDPDAPNPNYRKWEVAGVAHLPAPMFDTGFVGGTRQNPAEYAAVIRAGFHHLTNWLIDGVEPPPSQYIEGEPDPETGTLATERNADGNALGGIRLPHMVRQLEDGTEAGAPVGTYQGIDYSAVPSPDPTTWNILVALGGTFERFGDDRLAELYPTRDVYKERYIAALDAVLEEGYILQEDYDRYLALAEGIQVPPRPDPEPEPDAGIPGGNGDGDGGGGGCSMSAASGASNAATILGLFLIVGAFRLIHNRRRYGHR